MALDSEPLWMTQLRAQSRIRTGFPFQTRPEGSSASTTIRCKYKKPLREYKIGAAPLSPLLMSDQVGEFAKVLYDVVR